MSSKRKPPNSPKTFGGTFFKLALSVSNNLHHYNEKYFH